MTNIITLYIALSSAAYAAEDQKEDKTQYKNVTEIDFEDLEIEGSLQRPENKLIVDRKKASFNPLINLRQDWNEEMSQSVNEIK